MPRDITDIEILKDYIIGVMERSEHHANNIDNIVLAIVGAIIWKKDSDPIKVHTKQGEMKNVIWVKINGNKYAFSYNHDSQSVELREESTQGSVVCSINNSTPLDEVKKYFNNL